VDAVIRVGLASPVLTCRCCAALASSPAQEVDQAYAEGSSFLLGLGLDSRAEVLRILDTAMNPNSLYRDSKRSVNYEVWQSSLLRCPMCLDNCRGASSGAHAYRPDGSLLRAT
jgi:hypothetical protein